MNPVPFLDLVAHNDAVRAEIEAALAPVVAGAQFILGPAVERFERAFADYIGVRHCVGLNNGTSAIHLALQACDIGHGHEVITTPHTWISTTWGITYAGARPVYGDIDPHTYNLDPAGVETLITPRTRAILPVHLYGQAAALDELSRVARAHNLLLIEDAAQAHGARFAGRRVGSFGKAACFSFYPGKNLGAWGEAGAVVTNDDDLAERLRRLRDHAQHGRHHHVEVGYNARMEGVQAAVLEVKLRHLDRWNDARRRIAAHYHELLARVPGLVLPRAGKPEQHVWHLFVVRVLGMERATFRDRLQADGIATGLHYPTLVPLQPVYRHLGYCRGDSPVAEEVAATCVSLPIFPEMTDAQVVRTCNVIRACLGEEPALRAA